MKRVILLLKRYKLFVSLLVINGFISVFWPEMGMDALLHTAGSLKEMLLLFPPIFLLLGLFDVWVDRETTIKYMGPGSGLKGVLLTFSVGSFAAGPLYMAFPIAAMLVRKGTSVFNVFIFIGSWATTKVPMLLFEASNLGVYYTFIRLAINMCAIVLIAWVLASMMTEDEKEALCRRAEKM